MVKIVNPTTEEVHLLSNGLALIVRKVELTPESTSLIINSPFYSDSSSFWFSVPLTWKAPSKIKSIEIVDHSEDVEQTCGNFKQILEHNVGKNIRITKVKYDRGNEFTEKIEGKLVEICASSYCQIETVTKKNIIVDFRNINSVESIDDSVKLAMTYTSESTRQKIKVNYFTKEKTHVFLTHVVSGLSTDSNYRMFLDEKKGAMNLKFEVKLSNKTGEDLAPKTFHFHFGNAVFNDNQFALSANRNIFVLNPLQQQTFIPYSKAKKPRSVSYRVEGIESKKNSTMVIPIFEHLMNYEKVYFCELSEYSSTLNTKKIIRVKNVTKIPWVDKPVMISSSSHLVICRSNLPFVKVGEVAQVELKTCSTVRVIHSQEIEKINQIKQKQQAIIGQVIVMAKVRVKNFKEKDCVVHLKYTFPGAFTSSSLKVAKKDEKVVDDDLNPITTTLFFSMKIAAKSKKKKFNLKFTKWARQDALGSKMQGLDNFFKSNIGQPNVQQLVDARSSLFGKVKKEKKKKKKSRKVKLDKIEQKEDFSQLEEALNEDLYLSSGSECNDDDFADCLF